MNELLQFPTAFAVGYLLGVSIRQKWFKNRRPPAWIKLGLAAAIFFVYWIVHMFTTMWLFMPPPGDVVTNKMIGNLFSPIPPILATFGYLYAMKMRKEWLINIDPTQFKSNAALAGFKDEELIGRLLEEKYSPSMRNQVLIEIQVRGYTIDSEGFIRGTAGDMLGKVKLD